MSGNSIKAYLAAIGRRGGQAVGGDKAAASRENGKQPCAPGKKRGWPKGKKRKAAKRKSPNTSSNGASSRPLGCTGSAGTGGAL